MQKENPMGRKKGFRLATLTTDVSEVLRAINTNVVWKNSSGKLAKTQMRQTRQVKKNVMTEDDIDKLFAPNRPSPPPCVPPRDTHFKKQLIRVDTVDTKDNTRAEVPSRDDAFSKVEKRTKQDTEAKEDVNFLIHCKGVKSKLIKPIKDFANSVKFLKVDDSYDKLLSGLGHTEGGKTQIETVEGETDDLTAKFKRDYMVGKVVGEGAYASVRVAVFKPLSLKVAIKVYEKGRIGDSQRKRSVRREIRILQMLQHPNIVRIHDVVQTNNHLNIVMEYLSGIALSTFLKCQNGHRATEKHCRGIVRGLADALHYLHDRQIAHRDIKLENVILDEDLSPKLIDFGFSTCLEKDKKVKIFCGTPSYMAPEIVQKRQYHGEAADIWALGVLTFVTATGLFPFKGATDQQLYRKINAADYPKSELFFSKQLSDLIAGMLRVEPQSRLTAKQVLRHPWLHPDGDRRRADASDCRKRTTISAQKQKERDGRKLTETCHENLKLELRVIRQSPAKLNSTCTQRRIQRDPNKRDDKNSANGLHSKKDIFAKTNSKVLQLLKVGLKKKHDDKSKNKTKRS